MQNARNGFHSHLDQMEFLRVNQMGAGLNDFTSIHKESCALRLKINDLQHLAVDLITATSHPSWIMKRSVAVRHPTCKPSMKMPCISYRSMNLECTDKASGIATTI
jgi:hypothetical protein